MIDGPTNTHQTYGSIRMTIDLNNRERQINHITHADKKPPQNFAALQTKRNLFFCFSQYRMKINNTAALEENNCSLSF